MNGVDLHGAVRFVLIVWGVLILLVLAVIGLPWLFSVAVRIAGSA